MVITAPAQLATAGEPTVSPDQIRLLEACQHAAGHLYDAEVALHDAHQSHVDAWVIAAYEKLHEAIEAHTAAAAALALVAAAAR